MNDDKIEIPENALDILKLAKRFHRRRNFDDCLFLLHEGVKKFPKNSDIMNLIGITLADKDEITASTNHFISMILRNRDDDRAWENLSIVFNTNKDYSRAIDSYERTLEIRDKKSSSGAIWCPKMIVFSFFTFVIVVATFQILFQIR